MGSKSSGTTGYTYFAGFQMILARCIAKIRRIRVDKKIALTTDLLGGVFNINSPDLFGGSSGADPQGGVVATMNFQHGYADQTPDSYLQSKIGTSATLGQITASRGVAGVVCRQGNLGNSPYMKEWEFRAERVFIQDDGSAQWYAEKAGILVAADMVGQEITGTFFVSGEDYYHTQAGILFEKVGTSYTGSAAAIAQNALDAQTRATGVEYTLGGNFCYVVSQGSPGHPGLSDLGAYSVEFGPSVGISSVTVSGFCPVDYVDSVPGDILPGHIGIENASVVCTPLLGSVWMMNPAHMLREMLLNDEWGYGYLESDLDMDSFTAAADTLFNEAFGLGYFWDDETVSLDDLSDMIQRHIDAVLYVDRFTLKWTVKLIRNDYVKDDLPILTAGADIISIENFQRPQFLELTNTIIVNFYDMQLGATSSISLPNSALLLQQGVRITKQSDYGMICNRTLASRVGQRDLKVESNPVATGTLYLVPGPVTSKLHRGSAVKVTIPDYGMDEVVVRVTNISFGDGKTRRIKMTFAEDVFVLPDVEVIGPTPPVPPNENLPVALVDRLLMELPYFYLTRAFGQANVDQELANDPSISAFGICANREPNALYARLYVDTGAGYSEDGVLDFCPYGQLVDDIGKFDTELLLENTEDMEDVDDPMFFQMDSEIMSFVSRTDGTLTGLKRGLFDTVPASHVAGAKVFFFDNYLDSDQEQYAAGLTINVKLATVASGGTLSLADASTDSVTLDSRPARPYAPGNLKINGFREDALDPVVGPFTVSWSHRDRLLQQDQVVDTNDGDIGPEAGTTYTVKVFVDGILKSTTPSLSDNTFDTSAPISGTARVEVSAQRDGLTSWQAISSSFAYNADTSGTRTTRDGSTRITRDGSIRITR